MFKEILDKLSISSREAVIDGNSNSFDDFKDYLHIERDVDEVLKTIVLSSVKSDLSKLILISGNVGDGKSHMLARLYKKFPEEMSVIQVRNDATESNFINRSWIEELDEFLSPFRDDQLESEKPKHTRIVAINLGILSRFLNEAPKFYTKLQEFVSNNRIFDNLTYDNNYNEDSHFQFINLADYNLFSLTKDKATSFLLKDLLNKITQNTPDNPFYKTFINYYTHHPYMNSCVIRFNYLQLAKEEVKEGLINLIVYAIVKFKLIISIRDILNFVYDLIVPYTYQKISGEQIKQRNDYNKYSFRLEHSIFNKVFESEGRSELMNAIKRLDPLKLRSEQLDNLIFKLSSADRPLDLFDEKKIDFNAFLADNVSSSEKRELVKTFVRTLYIHNNSEFKHEFGNYYSFTKYLFAYHIGAKDVIIPLYKDVIKAIKCWNGNVKNDNEVNIPLGKQQVIYNITQNIDISPSLRLLEKKSIVKLNEFDTSLIIGIRTGNEDNTFTLDYNLYHLIQKVIMGYFPNKVDREDHMDFQQFVDNVTTIASEQNKKIIFERINGSIRTRYQLAYDQAFGYEFSEI